jgi:hypothetical protein
MRTDKCMGNDFLILAVFRIISLHTKISRTIFGCLIPWIRSGNLVHLRGEGKENIGFRTQAGKIKKGLDVIELWVRSHRLQPTLEKTRENPLSLIMNLTSQGQTIF